jgi:hypothetical protein
MSTKVINTEIGSDKEESKRLYVVCVSALILVLTLLVSAPFFYGYKEATAHEKFLGMTALYPTGQFYYMSVGPSQALKGEVLFSDKYERIAREQVILNPLANLIGGIALVFKVSLPIAFYIYRVLANIFLVLAMLYLARQFTPDLMIMLTAATIYCFIGGFDFYFNLFKVGIDAVEDSMPEANMFIAMSGDYYLPLANGLFIIVMALAYQIFFKSQKRILLCGIFLTLLGAVYIYGMVSAVVILTVAGLYSGAKQKRIRETFVSLIKLALFCIPIVAYYLWLMLHFSSITEDGWYNFPSILAVISTFGFGFLFSILGLIIKKRNKTESEFFLILWILLTLFLLFLPQSILPIQIQMMIGLGAPLAILSAGTLDIISARIISVFSNKKSLYLSVVQFSLIVPVIVLSAATNIKFYSDQYTKIDKKAFPYYLNRDVYDAMDWSSKNISDKKLVIISRELGFIYSSITACNVYCGVAGDNEVTKEEKRTKQVLDFIKKENIEEAKKALKGLDADYLFLDKTLACQDYEYDKGVLEKNYKECYSNSEVSIFVLK